MASAGSVMVSPVLQGDLSSTTPAAVAAAGAVGTGLTAARSDHAHAITFTVINARLAAADATVSLGTTQGLAAGGFVSVGGTTAATGAIRIPNNTNVKARSSAGADISLARTDASDNIALGDGSYPLYLQAQHGVMLDCGAVEHTINETGLTPGGASFLINVVTLNLQSGGTTRISTNGTGVGFFATTPVAKQAITGALSAVTDANAKAVLTSIITAGVNYGLFTNSTT